jgi:hypothetical protein
MDPVVVATGITTLLVPVVKKMTETFAGEAGKAVFTKASELLERLKTRFMNEPVASDVVRRFEKEPDRYQPMLRDVLSERLQSEPALAAELSSYLTEIKKAGPNLHIVQEVEKAEELIGAEIGRASAGNIRVEQKVADAKKVIGVKIDEIK